MSENDEARDKIIVREKGIYVFLPEILDRKVGTISQILPRKTNGRKWSKKDVIQLSVTKLVEKFEEYLDVPLTELMERAGEFNIENLDIDTNTEDLSASLTGLEEF